MNKVEQYQPKYKGIFFNPAEINLKSSLQYDEHPAVQVPVRFCYRDDPWKREREPTYVDVFPFLAILRFQRQKSKQNRGITWRGWWNVLQNSVELMGENLKRSGSPCYLWFNIDRYPSVAILLGSNTFTTKHTGLTLSKTEFIFRLKIKCFQY